MSDFKTLDKLLQSFVDQGLPGCALQIAQNGQSLYEGYFGYADLESGTLVSKDSVFRQASMSKLPLYTVMMMLYERGKFLLTDPIYDFFPEWRQTTKIVKKPNGYTEIVPTDNPVTISDVLSMKCGLPYCNFTDDNTNNETLLAMQKFMQPLWNRGHFSLREQIRAMANVPQAFEPGSHWLYGFSSELAAGIVEAVCAKPIDQVFEEMLFGPLGMIDTNAHYFGDIQNRMVTLYKVEDNNLVPIHTALDDKHLPGQEHESGWARLFSTVNDYTQLMQMLACGGVHQGHKILGRKTIDMMRTNGLDSVQQQDFEDSYNAGYGYGYGVRTLIDQEKGNHNGSLGAFGWTGGFGTWCEADPSEGVSIVYMHNRIPNDEKYYHLRVRTAAYGCIL